MTNCIGLFLSQFDYRFLDWFHTSNYFAISVIEFSHSNRPVPSNGLVKAVRVQVYFIQFNFKESGVRTLVIRITA